MWRPSILGNLGLDVAAQDLDELRFLHAASALLGRIHTCEKEGAARRGGHVHAAPALLAGPVDRMHSTSPLHASAACTAPCGTAS